MMQYPGQRIQIDVKFVPSLCLVNESQGSASISTLPLMNIPDGVSLRLFRSIVSIPPACFLNTLSRFSPVQLNVYRLTTGRSSQSALVLTAAQINLPFSRSALWSMRSGISWFVHLLQGTMARWKEATEKIMIGFMPLIPSILLKTSAGSSNATTAGTTTTFRCVL